MLFRKETVYRMIIYEEEGIYNLMLFPMESNVLKICRQYPKSNRQALGWSNRDCAVRYKRTKHRKNNGCIEFPE